MASVGSLQNTECGHPSRYIQGRHKDVLAVAKANACCNRRHLSQKMKYLSGVISVCQLHLGALLPLGVQFSF